MKNLPIGIQTLSEIVNRNCIYVDKTETIHHLLEGKYYFLSRPRRFGKSLLVDTLKQIFLGNKKLFKGFWIEEKIDWAVHPVIHIDMSGSGYKSNGLPEALKSIINREAAKYGVILSSGAYDQMFRELVEKLFERGPVVVLIDEYDKPIIDYLEDIPQAIENREILKNFYSVIKPLDSFLHFVFLTGVSKFSHVSIFSDLNNLRDITISPQFACLLGITPREIETFFSEYLDKWQAQSGGREELLSSIKRWYNGYSWDGLNFVSNPFSLINFFADGQFRNFWFRTGTPTFLTKLVKSLNANVAELENLTVNARVLDKFEIDRIDLISVLFQTGYLTIKAEKSGLLILDYPNLEVRESWYEMLLAMLNENPAYENESILQRMKVAIATGDTEMFMALISSLFTSLTYQQIEKKENYFHSIFYLAIKMLGFETHCEVLTSFGRIDVVIDAGRFLYIVEFKLGAAQEALDQIKNKRYADKYNDSAKRRILLGIGFDADKRTVGSWLAEEV
ncbi:MAG: AAA family ATPase [Bacteroidota bacterium]